MPAVRIARSCGEHTLHVRRSGVLSCQTCTYTSTCAWAHSIVNDVSFSACQIYVKVLCSSSSRPYALSNASPLLKPPPLPQLSHRNHTHHITHPSYDNYTYHSRRASYRHHPTGTPLSSDSCTRTADARKSVVSVLGAPSARSIAPRCLRMP